MSHILWFWVNIQILGHFCNVMLLDVLMLCAGFCVSGGCSKSDGGRFWSFGLGWASSAHGVQQCPTTLQSFKCISSPRLGVQYVWRSQFRKVQDPSTFECSGGSCRDLVLHIVEQLIVIVRLKFIMWSTKAIPLRSLILL